MGKKTGRNRFQVYMGEKKTQGEDNTVHSMNLKKYMYISMKMGTEIVAF